MPATTLSLEGVALEQHPKHWDHKWHQKKPDITLPDWAQTPAEYAVIEQKNASKPQLEMFGWDTAFAIRFADVNTNIANKGVSPSDFSQSDSSINSSASGTFGAWRLSGGSDTLLHMILPVTSGSMTYPDSSGHDAQIDLSGVDVEIEVALAALPDSAVVDNHAPNSTTTGGTFTRIGIAKSKPALAGGAEDQVASVLDVTGLPSDTPFSVKLYAQGLMQQWIDAHIADFTYAFASVNLNAMADQQGFQWLMPTAVGYAVYEDESDAENSIFGVLCMIGDNPVVPAANQISPLAIPEGQRSGFLISPQLVLEKMVMPALPGLFHKARKHDFEISADRTEITNENSVKNQEIRLRLPAEMQRKVDLDHIRQG